MGKKNAAEMERVSDEKSLSAVLAKADTNKIRDPYIFYDYSDTTGDRFQAGYAVLYPGCRTGGHSHDDAEEVYHVVSGRGVMHIGDESFEVSPGDTWLVPVDEFHWTDNPGNLPLELFWIVIKL